LREICRDLAQSIVRGCDEKGTVLSRKYIIPSKRSQKSVERKLVNKFLRRNNGFSLAGLRLKNRDSNTC
jgi:hypothetical protein